MHFQNILSRTSNPPPAANPAVALFVISWHQWRGVPEVHRWPAMHTMRHLFAILLISACVCWGSEQQGAVERFKMRATVQDVIVLHQFTGAVVQVHLDPRFALTLRIESVTPPLTNFTTGSVVTFAVHSPTKLFAGETPKGKTLDFVVSRETQAGKKTLWGLEVERKSGQPSGAANGSQPIRSETNSTPAPAGSRR